MVDHNDPLLNRAIDELRTLPPLDRDAVSRIVSAAARAREMGPAEDDELVEPRRDRGRIFHMPAVASIAAAAAIVGFVVGNYRHRGPASEPMVAPAVAVERTASSESAQTQFLAAAADASPLAPIATRFEFESSSAQRVSLVGDFNSWDDQATVLQRVPGTSRWQAIVRLIPGRHTYAFMVDGELQTDPNAPAAVDRELDVKTSVIIVGKP